MIDALDFVSLNLEKHLHYKFTDLNGKVLKTCSCYYENQETASDSNLTTTQTDARPDSFKHPYANSGDKK